MDELVILLLFVIATPAILAIAGFVLLFNSDAAKQKRGRNLLLGGILLFLVEVLIGYSICSNMNFGGLH
jgi:hypothetical protein